MKPIGRVLAVTSFIVILLLTACQPGTVATNSSGEKLPLFMDDFSDHDNGWKLLVSPQGIVQYDGDSLRILVNEVNTDYYTTQDFSLTDSILDIDASYVSGPSNNLFGLICRAQDKQNYYSFLISSDGYYGISKVENGVRTLLGSSKMQPTSLIATGGTTNHLRTDCVGENLTLFINWNQALTVKDSTFKSGNAGLIAATMEEPGVDIRFDNFIVVVP